MRLLALDIAYKVGWAAGQAPAAPAFGTFEIPRGGRSFGPVLEAYGCWLTRMLDEHRPARVIYEKPITTVHGKTRLETKCLLIGLCMHTEYICHIEETPVAWLNNASAKKHFTGRAGFGKKTKPYPMIEACHQRGWMVETTDEADACGIWDYAAHCYDPENAAALDPLLGGGRAA